MDRLDNDRRNYTWGSPTLIPWFAGEPAVGSPVAEEWMGTHPLGESRTTDGTALSQRAGRLPFMMKLLAAHRPLSLQVHPDEETARAGFAAEEAAGIAVTDPTRTYRDPHHKPEMVYALTQFDTLVGFRPTAEILRVLQGLDVPITRKLAATLAADPGFPGIVRMIEDLLADGVAASDVADVLDAARRLVAHNIDVKRAYVTVLEVAEHFPDDVGLLVALTLNRLTLQPGEAAFLGAGIIHAHLSGMCVEVMAESDNVMRAGLTDKHVDPVGLVRCLDAGMSRLARVTPELVGPATEVFAPDVREFALSVSQCSSGEPDGTVLPGAAHRLVVCTGGEVEVVAASGERLALERGQSLYASPDDGELRVVGLGEVVQAYRPVDVHPGVLVDLV